MNQEENEIELFDKHQEGKLSDVESSDFTKRLHSDEKFSSHFEAYENARNLVLVNGLRTEIEDLFERKKSTRIYLKVAAGLTFFLLSSLAIWQMNVSEEDFFESYYKPFPVGQSVRGDQDFDRALKLYENGQYDRAILLFGDTEKSQNKFIEIILGNCYLNTGNYEKAKIAFGKASKSQNNVVAQNAQWYLSMTLLRMGDENSAINELKKIEIGDMFGSMAKELVEKLEN